jgi:DivIVA domain-containing protein
VQRGRGPSGAAVAGPVGAAWHDRRVTTVLQYLVIAAVIGVVVFGAAVVVFGRGEQMAPLSPRTSPTELPDHDMTADDVRKVRFAMALRGYRMSDVDWALEKMADELDRLRAEVAELTGTREPVSEPVLAGVGQGSPGQTAQVQPDHHPVPGPVGQPLRHEQIVPDDGTDHGSTANEPSSIGDQSSRSSRTNDPENGVTS